MNEERPQKPRIVYSPPSANVIEDFARTACEELGPAFAEPNVVWGFAGFLKAIAQACANNLNREQGNEFDKPTE